MEVELKRRTPIEVWEWTKKKVMDEGATPAVFALVLAGDGLLKEMEKMKRFGQVASSDAEWPRA